MRFRLSTCLALASLIIPACDDSAPYELPDPQPDVTPPPGLWTVSGEPSAILRLEPAQLDGTGDRTPATMLTTSSASLATLTGVAFAGDGTLWMASGDDSVVLAFSAEALAASGTRAATRVIGSSHGSLRAPASLAFDVAHRLWIGNHASGTLVRFDPGQLAAGGAPDPAVTISGLGHPTGLAFDRSGALWVTDNVAGTIVRFDAAQLATSGTKAPAAIIAVTQSCFSGPSSLAFDASGNLWVANSGCDDLIAFHPDQVTTSGARSPAIVITSGTGFDIPVGLTFDQAGDLWILGLNGGLTRLAKSSLAASGAPTPTARLKLAGHNLFWSLALWPGAGLPIG